MFPGAGSDSLALFAALPLACIWRTISPTANFPYTEAFAREAPLDIGFPARSIPDRPCAKT